MNNAIKNELWNIFSNIILFKVPDSRLYGYLFFGVTLPVQVPVVEKLVYETDARSGRGTDDQWWPE
jgi:hypothetical protein